MKRMELLTRQRSTVVPQGWILLALWIGGLSAVYSDDALTAYEVLQQYNLPVGLLPKGVRGYDLDRKTGKFAAYFNGTCGFSLEGSYQLRYRSTIRGVLSNGRLRDLTGVSVKVLFFWLNIVEVVLSGDELQFSVGIASASFTIDNFYECPQCGCGLDCVNSHQRGSNQGRPFLVSTS